VLWILCSLFSCKGNEELTIVGNYEIDKVVSKNRANNIPDYKFLKINEDKTFELKYEKSDNVAKVKGKWELEKVNSEKSLVKFVYNNKRIIGTLKGSIFYFSYPNDFHNDKYESLLYVKLR
jgi:hypothetical protein